LLEPEPARQFERTLEMKIDRFLAPSQQPEEEGADYCESVEEDCQQCDAHLRHQLEMKA